MDAPFSAFIDMAVREVRSADRVNVVDLERTIEGLLENALDVVEVEDDLLFADLSNVQEAVQALVWSIANQETPSVCDLRKGAVEAALERLKSGILRHASPGSPFRREANE